MSNSLYTTPRGSLGGASLGTISSRASMQHEPVTHCPSKVGVVITSYRQSQRRYFFYWLMFYFFFLNYFYFLSFNFPSCNPLNLILDLKVKNSFLWLMKKKTASSSFHIQSELDQMDQCLKFEIKKKNHYYWFYANFLVWKIGNFLYFCCCWKTIFFFCCWCFCIWFVYAIIQHIVKKKIAFCTNENSLWKLNKFFISVFAYMFFFLLSYSWFICDNIQIYWKIIVVNMWTDFLGKGQREQKKKKTLNIQKNFIIHMSKFLCIWMFLVERIFYVNFVHV